MNAKLVIGIIIGALLIFSVVQIVQINSLKKGISGATGAATNQIDTSGWTENEKMNYEMHGTVPARYQGSAPASSGPAMVGGC